MLKQIPALRNLRYHFPVLKSAENGEFQVTPVSGVTLLARNEDLMIVDEVFHQRRYATLFPFNQRATILDVGAHCGYFSVFASRNSAPDSRIIGFEPDDENLSIARSNVQRNNCDNVALQPLGVSGQSGTVEFFRRPGAGAQHTIVAAERYGHEDTAATIEVISLADVFHRFNLCACDFMKLDCEGAEYGFLYEAPPDILRSITTISMEFHDSPGERTHGSDMASFLASLGFTIVDFCYCPTRRDRNFGRLLVTRRW